MMGIEQIKLTPVQSPAKIADTPVQKAEKSFGEYLTDAIGEVNQLQRSSEQAAVDLAAGRIQDVSQAVIATEKATIALQLTMQVRNKVVEAYQEMTRMQV